MEKKITITVDSKGDTKIEASGYQGGECLNATKPYEQALGADPSTRKEKLEMHQQGNAQVNRMQSHDRG